MVCYIWMFHIYPITNFVCHFFPHMNICENAFFTFFYEFFYTVFFDLLFSRNTKFLFYFKFNRKSMCVPTCFSINMVTFHYFVSRDYVFHNSCFDMSNMWFSICCWRSIIKCKISLTFIHIKIFLDYVVFLPVICNFVFHSNKAIF